MAALSYEVGAIFTIEDEASGVLSALADQFSRLGELITTTKASLEGFGKDSLAGLQSGLERLSETLTGLDTKAQTLGTSLTSAADAAGSAFTRATEQANNLAAAYERATAAAGGFAGSADAAASRSSMGGGSMAGALVPVPRTRGNYGDPESGPPINMGGTGQGLLGGPDEEPAFNIGLGAAGAVGGKRLLKPGDHGLLHGMMPLAEVASGVEAEKNAMETDLAIRQTLIGMNISPDSPEGKAAYKSLHTLAGTSTRGTIFSSTTAAKAMAEAGSVLGFSGKEGIEKFEKTYPVALRLGELSQMRGKGGLAGEAVAGEEFGHLTDQYDPAGLEKELNVVNAIAKRGDTSVARQLSIMKYGLPIAMAAGIDPNKAAVEMGSAEQIMGPTSTVGTGYAQMLLGVLKAGGGINANLSKSTRSEIHKQEREFEHSIRLQPGAIADYHKATRGSSHEKAMAALGFTAKTVAEHQKAGDLGDFIEHQIHTYAVAHPNTTLPTLINAFGVRGGRYAEHYMSANAIARQQRYGKGVTGAMTVHEEQDTLSKAPMQQFEQMLANLSDIGTTLATATLPALNIAFKALNAALTHTEDFLNSHHRAAEAGGVAVLGAAGLALIGGAKTAGGAVMSAIKSGGATVGKLFGLGGSETATASGLAAGGADAAVSKGVANFLLGPVALAAPLAGDTANNPQATQAMRAQVAKEQREYLARHQDHKAAAAAAAPITIHVGPVTMSGVADKATYDGLLSRLTHSIKAALSHASGPGQGTDSSVYTMGTLP